MPKLLLTVCLVLFALMSFAQATAPMFRFTGRIIGPDSLPVENAYLVNYRNAKAYATNSDGTFNIPVMTGDSLKFFHVAYQSKIVKLSPYFTTISVEFEDNIIEEVTVKSIDIEMINFNKNANVWGKELEQLSKYNYHNTKVQNPYNTNQYTGTTGILVSDIIKLFKKKKKK